MSGKSGAKFKYESFFELRTSLNLRDSRAESRHSRHGGEYRQPPDGIAYLPLVQPQSKAFGLHGRRLVQPWVRISIAS